MAFSAPQVSVESQGAGGDEERAMETFLILALGILAVILPFYLLGRLLARRKRERSQLDFRNEYEGPPIAPPPLG
jgi:hypothetical protein